MNDIPIDNKGSKAQDSSKSHQENKDNTVSKDSKNDMGYLTNSKEGKLQDSDIQSSESTQKTSFPNENIKKEEEIEILNRSLDSDPHSKSNPKSSHSNDSNQDILINQHQDEQITDKPKEKYTNGISSIVKLKDIWVHFSQQHISNEEALIVENFNKGNCFTRLFIQCSSDYKLLPQLKEERLRVFSIAKTPYDKANHFHNRCFEFIYNFLLQLEHPESYNWELIGFQGDPQKDLRSVGMMGAIQMIALIEHYPQFTLSFFDYLWSIQSEWIFAILLLNMTKLTLDLLKKGLLIVYCNKRRKVFDTLNRFFFGLVSQLHQELLSESDNVINENNTLTMDYIATLNSYIEDFAQKNPGHFLWNESQLSLSYPSLTSNSNSPNVK